MVNFNFVPRNGSSSNLKFFKGRAKQVPFPVALETANP